MTGWLRFSFLQFALSFSVTISSASLDVFLCEKHGGKQLRGIDEKRGMCSVAEQVGAKESQRGGGGGGGPSSSRGLGGRRCDHTRSKVWVSPREVAESPSCDTWPCQFHKVARHVQGCVYVHWHSY